MKKATIAIIVFILLVVLAVLTTINWQENVGAINDTQNDERIIMKVNNIIVTEKDFELLKLSLAQTDKDYDDKAIKELLIRRAVIDSEINKHAITVSDEEVFAFNEERFALLYQDKENATLMNDFLKKNNLSLEDYKKQSLAISKQALLTLRLKEKLIEDYKTSNQKNFFETYIKEKIDAAQIEFYD